MDQSQSSQLRSKLLACCSRTKQWLVALPFKAQIVLGVFLFAALLLALHTAFWGKSSSLHLRVQHGYRNAQLTVLIDGRKVYSGRLVGYSKKKYAVFGETVEGSLSQVFPVSSGTHEILVRVEPGDGTVQEDSVSGDFARGTERELSVAARHSGLTMQLQEVSAEPGEGTAETSSSSWFSRYAGSLFLTIAGSIASALTGFAIKEVPAYFRSRQAGSVKSPEPSN